MVNAKIEVQKKKLAALKDEYNNTFNDARKSKLQEQIVNTEASILRLTQTSDATVKKIWALEDGANKTADSFKNLSNTLKQLGVSSADIDKLEHSFNKANPEVLRSKITEVSAEMKRLGASSEEIDKVTRAIERSGTGAYTAKNEIKSLGLAYAGLAAAMGAIITKSVQTAADFEQSMANVKAISQATGAEFESLKKQALDLGATTRYTAAQAADAQALLAQAGFKTKDILASLPGVLSLASAGQTDLATTADITASALNGFGLAADQAGRVADVLAKSSIDTNADVTDLGFAMKYVAPVAANMSVSIEEATAAIGELSNAGIKGEMAGTQLRAILLALASPSKDAAFYMERLGVSIKDSAGNIKPLSTIIGDLQKSFTRLTQAQQADVAATLVGREAASGFLTLISQGKETLDKYTTGLQNAGGTAQQVADTQMDTLKGATLELQSALEAAGIAMGDKLAPAIRQVAEFVTGLLQGFTGLNPSLQTAIVAFGAATAAVLGLVAAVGALSIAFTALNVSFPILGAISLAIGAVSAGVAALVSESNQAAEAVKKHDEAQKSLNETLSKSPLQNSVEELEALKEKTKELQDVLEKRAAIEERIKELEANGDLSIGPGIISELDLMRGLLDEIDQELNEMGYDNIDMAKQKFEELTDAVKASVPAMLKAQEAEVAKLATEVEHIDKMKELKKQYDDLSSMEKLSAQQKAQLAGVVEALTKEYPGLIAKLDEENQWHITNVGSLNDLIGAEKASVDASAKAAKDRLNNWKVETEAKLKLAQAQINALEKIEKFNFANSALGKRLPGETAQGLEIIGDMVVSGIKAKAQSNANEYQKTLNQINQDINKITVGAYDKFTTNQYGSGIDLTKPEKEKKAKKKKAKKGKSAEELAAEARKKAYDSDVATIRYQAEMFDWSAEQQIAAYEKLRTKHKQFLKESIEDRRTLDLQIKRLTEDTVKSRYEFSAEWIKKEERRMEDSGKNEVAVAQMKLDAWTRVLKRYKKDSDEYKQADEEVYNARKALARAQENEAKRQYDASAEWIKKEERRMQDAGKSEQEIAQMKLDAWTRVRDRYTKDSDLYKKADEEVYQARKSLVEKTQKLVDESVKKQKAAINDAKKAELDAIEERKKAALADYDARIKAIDDLIAKEAELNVDADFETQIAEKQARADLLASAVGPEGIQEREDILKEIERMKLEHDRELRKRELESQKTALQDEKDAQSKAFDDEKAATEKQYSELAQAFENYSGDIKMIEAAISVFRVNENANANAQILADLDAFVAQYNAKMATIAEVNSRDSDLAEYNANKDAWAAAKARGDSAEMARLAARNDELRKKYGITKDTGKLQSFSTGGIVQGNRGEPVIAQVHAGEIVLNPQQQAALWDVLNGGRALAPATVTPSQSVVNHIDMSIDKVEVADPDTAEALYNERERVAARMQTQGVKVR
ncbi:phage tail tape measure protein [Paenibacillus sp. VCA1]|uniref:phage tail tape measure protein n=1 Tax=Paenibacillus sp. VCA1 TaxID=3039148 RepID=UPI002870FE6B|nr:phage tail tape measure protein [Paenibacillus sp. VCA1]MDR9852891.1 phage tail tape measure protein [Paenibacillus sp. VCA1]